MATSPRLVVIAAVGALSLSVLTGCGGEATGARTTLATVQNTSYVVQDPITTTTTTSLPPNASTPEGGTSPTEQIHIIVAGDSISRIAGLFGVTNDDIINYNGWTDGLNHLLIPGDPVKIPPESRVPGAGGGTAAGSGSGTDTGTGTGSGTTPPSGTEPAGEGCTHTIVANDNPTRVAEQYDIPVAELEAANAGNPAYSSFLIGSELNIPPGGDC